MVKVIIAILSVWLVWIGYQYISNSETAYSLIKLKIEEFDNTDTNILLQKVGKEYEYKEVQINGKKYWITWIIRKAISPSVSYKGNAIEIRGRVDFIELLPFTNLRVGSPFRLIIYIKENN